LLLAEGISFARFLRPQETIMLKKPARYRGPSRSNVYRQKTEKDGNLPAYSSVEALKSLGACGGNVET